MGQNKDNDQLAIYKTISVIAEILNSPVNFNQSINDSIKYIGEITNADRSYIFEFSDQGKFMNNTFEWCAKGISPQINNLQEMPSDIFPWWMSKMKNDEFLLIEDVSILPKEANAEKEILQAQNIRSLLALPLKYNGQVFGFIGVDNISNTSNWKNKHVNLLNAITSLFNNAFSSNNYLDRLEKNENLYRSLIESMSDSIFLLKGGIIVFANNNLFRTFGYSKSEILNHPFLQFVHPEERPFVIDYYQKRVSGIKVDSQYCSRGITKSGKAIYFEVTVSEILHEGEHAEMVILKDITFVKESEVKLKESTSRYKSLFLDNNAPILIIDPKDGKIVDANKAAATFYKSTTSKLKRKYIYEINTARPEEINMKMARASSKNKNSFEFKHRLSDGVIRDVEVSSGPIFFDGKKYLYSLVNDITERKQFLAQLTKEREQLISLFESIDEPIYVSNTDNHEVLYMNKTVKRLFGDHIGGKCYKVFHNFDSPCSFCNNKELLNNTDREIQWESYNSYVEKYYKITNKIIRWNEIKNARFEFAIDVTDLSKSRNELIGAKEKAEESDQLKSSFLANMSHEIRTPLNSIIGFSELVADNDFSKKEKLKFQKLIKDNSLQLTNIIEDIVDISKIETQQIKLDKKEIELSRIIDELHLEFNHQAKEKGLSLLIELPTEFKTKFINDEYRIKQVFKNLITNALKFTDSGNVSFGCFANKKNEIVFFVKDSGIGIKEEEISLVFDRFRQVHRESNKVYGGNGLGLAISKSLVELMGGGKIWVVSAEGKGSEFYFALPL